MSAADMQSVLAGVDWVDVARKFGFLTVPGIALAIGLAKFRPLARIAVPKLQDEQGGATQRAAGQRDTGGKDDKQARAKAKQSRAERKRARAKAKRARLLGKAASNVSVVGLVAAGLGLVPLAHVVFQLVSLYKWGPPVAGLVVVVLGLAKLLLMLKDLKDGKVDKPWLWLTPVPLLAMLLWVGPVVWQQATDQAKETGQMMFGDKDKSATPAHHHTGHNTHHKPNGDGKP